MIEPYQALGLVPTMRGIRRRDDIQVNLEHLSHLIKAASWLSSLDLPVRLIAVPEGALQGFNDEVLDLDLDAFYPVADTEIGRLGFLMANEGSYPENARGLAMNGAEVVYRGPYPHPHVGNGLFEIQNRARALDNNFYLIACNVGTYYLTADSDTPIDTFGGGSAVIDFRGQIVGRHDYSGGSSWVAGTVDVEALRKFRASAQWDNWVKDLTTEQYQLIYEEPVYPKNLYLDRAPYTHAEYRREVIDRQIKLMHDRDIWRRPDKATHVHNDGASSGLGEASEHRVFTCPRRSPCVPCDPPGPYGYGRPFRCQPRPGVSSAAGRGRRSPRWRPHYRRR